MLRIYRLINAMLNKNIIILERNLINYLLASIRSQICSINKNFYFRLTKGPRKSRHNIITIFDKFKLK